MKKYQRILNFSILAVVVLVPRLINLDAFMSPDEPQWERNTQNFVTALKSGDTKNFYQQPHPGITTQWLGAFSIDESTWGAKRFPLTLFLGVAILYIAYLIRTLYGCTTALFAGFLLALNPLLIAHSRVLAMDALLSVFMIAAVLHHLLWLQKKHNMHSALTGLFTALAILSKMAGLGVIAYLGIASIALFIFKKVSTKELLRGIGWYLVGLGLTTIVVFPTIVTDFQYVLEGSKQFFATEHFQQQVHALGQWWYPEAFLLWTTPLQLLGLLAVPFALYKKSQYRLPIMLFLLFVCIFFFEIQYSIKKGDRYMLPVFVSFDVIAGLAAGMLMQHYKKLVLILYLLGVAWQGYEIFRLHPYELAYRNPFFAHIANGRTMGWGEGLDLAAQYLNNKPNAENLLVAAYYEGSFAQHFKGKFTSAERLAKETPEQIGTDYVVLYRTMQGRAQERWETKVLKEYSQKNPEHVITLNNEEYVWIYKTDKK